MSLITPEQRDTFKVDKDVEDLRDMFVNLLVLRCGAVAASPVITNNLDVLLSVAFVAGKVFGVLESRQRAETVIATTVSSSLTN